MNVEMISKIIFSLALITCIVLLFLDKKQSTNQPVYKPKTPKTPSTNKKTINKWSASVPMNNQSTTQQPIIMYTGLNTITYGDNKTFIPIGTYKTDIPIVSNNISTTGVYFGENGVVSIKAYDSCLRV